jgi:hypothetical protein
VTAATRGLACDCGRNHRTWRALAKCRYPDAAWVWGDPPAAGPCFALLAHCRVLTVTLWAAREDAEREKAVIDETACGGRCWRAHEVVEMGGAR